MHKAAIYLLLLILTVPSVDVLGQETDPYEDYSYLWEGLDKKKKKKKKKGKNNQVLPTPEIEYTAPDSISDTNTTTEPPANNPTTNFDNSSLSNETNIVSDSLSNTDLNTPILTDDSFDTSDLENATEVVKPSEGPRPSNDFRAGLPGIDPKTTINAGLTFTNIAGQNYVGLTLSPEFAFGKVGIGLNVPILYGLDDNAIRTEIFEDGVGPARIIRYVRYGTQKRDPYYFRLGELDNVMIGFGGLVNNYTNTISYEKRKLGLHYDVNYRGYGGIEGLYSDFDPKSLNLLVFRPYVRPLITTDIPVARTLEIGATFLFDNDQTEIPASDSTSTSYIFTEPGVSAFAIDAGITVLQSPFLQIDLFGGYSKLSVSSQPLRDAVTAIGTLPGASDTVTDGFQNGSGINAGVNFRFHFIADILDTDVRIERLQYQDHFIPQFFDATYELNKDARIFSLATAGKQGGIYGSLTGHIIKKVRLGGSLMIPDDISDSSPALVRVHADLDRLFNKFSLHGSYVKGGLTDLGDAFKLDERSLAKVRFTYFVNSILTAGVEYYWSFALDETGAYRATSFVSPFIGVSVQF